jgi:hypothetical protein
MVMRKGTVFRASKLVYAEIGSTHEAARPLAELGLIEEDPQLGLDELFDLLQKPEIVKVFQLAPHVSCARPTSWKRCAKSTTPNTASPAGTPTPATTSTAT